MYAADIAAANHDAGWKAEYDLDMQAATAAKNALAAENCNGGGGYAPTGSAFGQAYVPITAVPGTTANKLQWANNNMNNIITGLGILANQDQEREQAAAQAAEQARQEQAEREAQQAQQRAAEAAADAQHRGSLTNPFDNGGGQQSGANGNPFEQTASASPVAQSGGNGNPFDVATTEPQPKPSPGTYPATLEACKAWGGFFESDGQAAPSDDSSEGKCVTNRDDHPGTLRENPGPGTYTVSQAQCDHWNGNLGLTAAFDAGACVVKRKPFIKSRSGTANGVRG